MQAEPWSSCGLLCPRSYRLRMHDGKSKHSSYCFLTFATATLRGQNSQRNFATTFYQNKCKIRRNEIPKGWSLEAADFINKTIQRKPNNRLGNNGPSEIRHHPWLKDFPWEALKKQAIKAPFLPPVTNQIFLIRCSLKTTLTKLIRMQNGKTKIPKGSRRLRFW